MDLADLDVSKTSNEGAVMELIHPVNKAVLLDENKKPMYIRVAGKYSDSYRSAQRKVTNRRLKARGKIKLTAEELEVEAIDILARCVLDWNIVIDKKRPECTVENVRAVLSDDRFPWIKEQLDDFIDDDANFMNE